MRASDQRDTGVAWGWWVAAAIVAAIAFLTFRHTLGHEFVNWDDDVYVTENPALRSVSFQTIGWLFTRYYYYAYIPVTLASHAFDVMAWGMNPHGHHLTNVLLHTANAVWILILGGLLFQAGMAPASSRKGHATMVGASLAAILFAVHPLRAESVSWISDRKDLLCAFFALPAVIAYLMSLRRESRRWWLASFLLFVLAVLSKSTAVVVPAVLLVLNWLQNRGITLRDKLPFWAVSLVVTAISLKMTPPAIKLPYAMSDFTPLQSYLFPFYVLAFPLYKTLVPVGLSPIYPRIGLEWMVGALAAVAAITAGAILLASRGKRATLAAWAVYLLLLISYVVGLSSGLQPVADRYSYLATIPIFLFIGGGIALAWDRGGAWRLAPVGAATALIVLMVGPTISCAARWKTSISLWESVVAQSPPRRDYTDAYLNLSAALFHAQRYQEASAILAKAAVFDSSNADVYLNRALVLYAQNDSRDALECLRRATALEPANAKAFYYRALVSADLRLDEESVTSMLQAARLGSKDAQQALAAHGIRW
jgi:tetratricopeptide (TPR) repeat protein